MVQMRQATKGKEAGAHRIALGTSPALEAPPVAPLHCAGACSHQPQMGMQQQRRTRRHIMLHEAERTLLGHEGWGERMRRTTEPGLSN